MPNGSEYREIKRTDGGNLGGVLTITQAMRDGGARAGWIPYFHVKGVEEAVGRAEAMGATTHMPPTKMHVGTLAMVADPQGAPFYLMDPVPPAERSRTPKATCGTARSPATAAGSSSPPPTRPAAKDFYTQPARLDSRRIRCRWASAATICSSNARAIRSVRSTRGSARTSRRCGCSTSAWTTSPAQQEAAKANGGTRHQRPA